MIKNKGNRRGGLSKTKKKNFELAILELNKKLAILEASKNEKANLFTADKEKLSNVQQNIRDIRQFGGLKPI